MSDPVDRLLERLRSNIRGLKAYQPGKPIEELQRELGLTDIIKIASNENPMGPSPLAVDAGRAALAEVHAYPDGGAFKLRAALAERHGVDPSELVFGAGSNELIYLVMAAFCGPGDRVVAPRFSFISYKLAARAFDLEFVESEVNDLLGADVDALIAAATPDTRVVFLANPNNPTGAHMPVADFDKLVAALAPETLLVVDEAYHEYAVIAGADYPQSQRYRADRPNTITLRTFSKIYGLAGLRVGYGLCDARIADVINRVRRPFNVNSVAQAAALAALDDDAHVRTSADAAARGIPMLSEAVEGLGLRAYPSLGNFVLVDVARDTGPVYQALLARGVIVRPMAAWGLPRCVRISVGTPAETERVAAALRDVLS
jgi:histidinol-phosphate aminotransferase